MTNTKLNNYEIRGDLALKISKSLDENRNKFLSRIKAEEEKEKVRSVDEALKVLKVFDYIKSDIENFLKENPNFKPVFEKEYEKLDSLELHSNVLSKIFYDEDLFQRNDYFVISVEGEFDEEMVESYFDLYSSWKDQVFKDHEKTQSFLRDNFELHFSQSETPCRCLDCSSFMQKKIRDAFVEELNINLDKLEDELFEDILEKNIDQISFKITKFLRRNDKNLKSIRFKIKKSSYNRLNLESRQIIEDKLGYTSKGKLVLTYSEKVKSFLISVDDTLKADFFDDSDFGKFFERLNLNIWKHSSSLKREFSKYTRSLLTLKRKDISSTILRNYLGQFWLFSEARRKTRKVYYHMGPTNSGKTYHALQALAEAKTGCYLAPLRLLAGEIFDTLSDRNVVTTLLTGEEVIEKPDSTHYSSTIEMAKLHQEFDCVVIDEIQMIGDYQRGWAWTRALVHMNAEEIHICGDPSALGLVEQILKLTGDELIVKNYERMTDLVVEKDSVELKDLRRGDALIVFSRRNALKHKVELEKLDHKVSIVYGMLNPDVRREQARRFDEGETDIIVSTDAISMGMNLPVRRIVFTAFSKFIQSVEHPLTKSELKQIAGRAGRYKRFPTGYVTYLERADNKGGGDKLEDALHAELMPREKAMVGPDLDLFLSVNKALEENKLSTLSFSEFLRLFYTIEFSRPFFCVRLDEMIEIAEMVEEINDKTGSLSHSEIFGFACAPVNLGNIDHVQYFHSIVNKYAHGQGIYNELIDTSSNSIDYLETSIKCLELYQWLARHFDNKYFEFDNQLLHQNKSEAVEKLNKLLSEKTIKYYNPYSHFGKRSKSSKNSKRGNFKKKKFKRSKSETKSGRSRNFKGKKPRKQTGRRKKH